MEQIKCSLLMAAIAVLMVSHAPAQKSVKTVKAESVSSLKQVIKKPATVYAYKTADMYAKVGGYLKNIKKDIGDKVTTKDTLAELDIPEMEQQLLQKKALIKKAEAELAQAKATLIQARKSVEAADASIAEAKSMSAQKEAKLKLATINYNRIAQLVAKGAVNQDRLDTATFEKNSAKAGVESVKAKVATAKSQKAAAEAAVTKAKADIHSAEANIKVAVANLKYVEKISEYATIKPPFDGKITKRMFDEGAFIQSAEGNSAAKPIFQIVQTDMVRIVFSVSSSEIANLSIKDKVVFSGQQGSGIGSIKGEVSRYSAGLDAKTRMLRVEMDVVNDDNRLIPGQFGNVMVTLDTVDKGIRVPKTAVSGGRVFVIENGKARAKKVELAFFNRTDAIIRSGLSEGQEVIAVAQNIADGESVTRQ